MPDRDAHEGTAMKVPGVVVIVLCSWGASILIPLTLWSAASRTGPFRRASDEARLADLDRQRPPVPPQVPGHVRIVLSHSATEASAPKNADDVAPAQTPPLSRAMPASPSADEAAGEPASPAPSAQPQQPAQAVQAAAAAEPPRASTADALDDRRGAESQAGAGASPIPIFMRVAQLPTVHDEDFAPRPQAVRRREATLREEFRAHKAAHSYHYRRVMVRRWAPANPFVSLARLLFH
jgi:hypothetical protein